MTAPTAAGEVLTRRVITVVLALITALTFAFGFGNVWALGRSLGVPALVAPLVGPAVDLSVAGLLIGIRHLSMAGVPRDQLRAARILLTGCGAAELALNIAGPVAAGAYGRAAFDAVGPLLLLGWAETGPGLLRHLYAMPSRQPMSGNEAGQAEPVPDSTTRADHRDLVRTRIASEPGARRAGRRDTAVPVAGLDDLLARARQIDQEHRVQHGRPVSAETLRKQMRIGSMRARTLVQRVRQAHDPATRAADEPGPGPQPHRRHARPSHADDDRRRQPPAHPGELAAIPS